MTDTTTDALVEWLRREAADPSCNAPRGEKLYDAADTIAALEANELILRDERDAARLAADERAARIATLEAENERLKQKSVEFVSQSEARADQAMQHGRIISGQRDRIAALEEALREIANKPRSAVPPYDIARRALGASL